jgi:hypothetical protein
VIKIIIPKAQINTAKKSKISQNMYKIPPNPTRARRKTNKRYVPPHETVCGFLLRLIFVLIYSILDSEIGSSDSSDALDSNSFLIFSLTRIASGLGSFSLAKKE